MKRNLTLLAVMLVTVIYVSGQSITDTIKPTPATSKYVFVYDLTPSAGDPNNVMISAGYNTVGGVFAQSRTYIYYDLSSIPTNAIVTSAYLNLFFDSLISPTTYSGSPGQNGTKLSMVNQAWNPDSVTWNIQPTISNANEVIVGPTAGIRTNITNIYVDTPVQMWVANPTSNYGWRFWQISEYTVQQSQEDFASSFDTLRPDKMPYLVVTYTFPSGTKNISTTPSISIFPNPTTDQITVSSSASDMNYDITLFDMIGNKVLSKNSSGLNTRIDISSLSKGIYMLQTTDATGQTVSRKIVKE